MIAANGINNRTAISFDGTLDRLDLAALGQGAQQLRVEDPVTQQSAAVGERYGEYRLLFQSLENDNIRVDIHADMTDGRIALYFYDINQGALGSSELRLYEQLEQRVKFEYGAEHVRASRP